MWVRVLSLALLNLSTDAQCLLCEGGVGGLKNPSLRVDSKGKSCAAYALELYSHESSSTECLSGISQHRYNCCVNPRPVDKIQEERSWPKFTGKRGPYRECKLCWNGNYPRNTGMVINMLYIGTGSCAQYYLVAEGGFIPNHLCQTLQHFAFKPCGC